MISALAKAFAQLPHPAFRRVLVIGIAAALVTFIALNAALWWLLIELQLFQTGWIDAMIDVLGGVAVFVLSLIFFPAIVTIVVGVLLDDIVRAVEARHYPTLPPARERPWIEDLATTLRFAAVTLLLNLLAIPVYLVLLFTGFGILVFYVLNGYLLGREYFELVALRRLDRGQATALRRANRLRLWLAGAGITFLLSLPVINLVAPMLATAFMVHLFEALRQRQPLV